MEVDNNSSVPRILKNDDNQNYHQPDNNSFHMSEMRQAAPQFIAVGVKNILLLGYGMTLGYPTIVIPAIQGGSGRSSSDITLSKDQISWFSSINLICVPVGCILSGAYSQPFGKIRAMQVVNILIIIAWLLFHFGTNIIYLYAALCLQGLAGGLMEAPVLTYVAEITQPKYRGILAASGSTFVILGVFLQFVLGSILDWRRIAAICTVLPVLSILALFFVPESPTWLIRQNRYQDAIKSLQWLRGWVPEKFVENEFHELYDNIVDKQIDENKKKYMCLKELALLNNRSFWSPFMLILFTFFVGHFSGKTALQTYAVQIFHTLKAPINKYYATVILGLCELISTILCVILVHFTGKRPLVFTSLLGCGLCFFGAGIYAYLLPDLPGYGINNIVQNATLSKENVIFTNNITNIFNEEEKSLIGAQFVNIVVDEKNYITTNFFPSLETMESLLDTTTFMNEINGLDSKEISQIQHDDFDEYPKTTTNFEETAVHFSEDPSISTTTIKADLKLINSPANALEAIKSEIDKLRMEAELKLIIPIPNQQIPLLWIPLVLLLGAAFFSHLGIRVLPWMLIGEVFPVTFRSTASGLAGGCGYVFGFLANKLFLQMLAWLTMSGTFWFYSSVALTGFIVLYFVLLETEGKTLAEIENYFAKKEQKTEIEMSSKILPDDKLPLPIGLLEVPVYIQGSQTGKMPRPMQENSIDVMEYNIYLKNSKDITQDEDSPKKTITRL